MGLRVFLLKTGTDGKEKKDRERGKRKRTLYSTEKIMKL